ncbi:MAG: 50S ribosomal protein L13 [Acidobacteriota bacterium]
MRTFMPSPGDIPRGWWLVDATDMPLGRLATVVAAHLRGKHKPMFTPFLDTGDHVIIINADKVTLSGRKLDQKVYYRVSGQPGGLKATVARKMLATKPEFAVEEAVWGMLPKGSLGRKQFGHLKVYRGSAHPHEAQQPVRLDLKKR